MQKINNHKMFQYLLILCFSFVLIFLQTNKLHSHLVDDDHASVVSAHVHDFELINHHGEDYSTQIDTHSDNLINKVNSLNPLLLILLVSGFFLYIPRLVCLLKKRRYKIRFIACYYLIQPPLRAPPIS